MARDEFSEPIANNPAFAKMSKITIRNPEEITFRMFVPEDQTQNLPHTGPITVCHYGITSVSKNKLNKYISLFQIHNKVAKIKRYISLSYG